MAKRTRFACTTQIFSVESLFDMSEDEVAASFYNKADYRRIRADTKRDVRSMLKGDLGKITDTCSRGLEHLKSRAHLEQRNINKDCVTNAVFLEQERQRSVGTTDEDEVAEASKACSKWARDLALSNGASDAAYVLAIGRRERRQQVSNGQGSVLKKALDLLHVSPSDTPVHRSTHVNIAKSSFDDVVPAVPRVERANPFSSLQPQKKGATMGSEDRTSFRSYVIQ